MRILHSGLRIRTEELALRSATGSPPVRVLQLDLVTDMLATLVLLRPGLREKPSASRTTGGAE